MTVCEVVLGLDDNELGNDADRLSCEGLRVDESGGSVLFILRVFRISFADCMRSLSHATRKYS